MDPTDKRVTGKIVTISFPKRIKLFQDARIELDVPTIGSGTKLNISSVGTKVLYDSTTVIEGALAGSTLAEDLAANMGIEARQRLQIHNIISNVAALTESLKSDLPQIVEKLNKSMDNVDPLLTDLRAAAADIRQLTADVSAHREQWIERLDHLVESADEAVTGIRDLVKDKSPALRQTIDNVAEVTRHVRDKTLAQIDDALDKATTSLANVRQASAELKTFIVGQRPVLERAVANAHLTTAQLKLAAIEVRRSPWRLLYKPNDKELESDNLYDAARSFAMAAGALDSAAQSLRSVGQQQPQDRDQIAEMLDRLEALFERFERAEDGFWKALKGRPAESSGPKTTNNPPTSPVTAASDAG
jgi:ABC-type transporter Mla subunit MlaD